MGEQRSENEPDVSLVVFDFDGVFTRGDSLTALIVRGIAHRPPTMLRAVPLFTELIRSAGNLPRRHRAVSALAGLAFSGASSQEFAAATAALAQRWARSRWRVRHSAFAALRRHAADGARVVIATATEERFAVAFLGELGVQVDLILASRIQLDGENVILAPYNLGERKTEALRLADVQLDAAVFYTDSATDLPTARACAVTVLVAPGHRTVRQFRLAGIRFTRLTRTRRRTGSRSVAAL